MSITNEELELCVENPDTKLKWHYFDSLGYTAAKGIINYNRLYTVERYNDYCLLKCLVNDNATPFITLPFKTVVNAKQVAELIELG